MKKQLKPLPTAVQVPLFFVFFLFAILFIGGAAIAFMMGFYFVVSSLIFDIIPNTTVAILLDALLRISLAFVFLISLIWLICMVMPTIEWISGLFFAVKKEKAIAEHA